MAGAGAAYDQYNFFKKRLTSGYPCIWPEINNLLGEEIELPNQQDYVIGRCYRQCPLTDADNEEPASNDEEDEELLS